MKNKPIEKNNFAAVMYGLAGNFGGKISKDDLRLRFEALKEYSIKDIQKAGTWLIKNRENTFPAVPTTKEIIDAIKKVTGIMSREAVAEIEADKVLKKLKHWGRDAQPLFYDDVTKYLMSSRWTFKQIAKKNEKDLDWWRKAFVKAYIEADTERQLFLDVTEKAGLLPHFEAKRVDTK